MYLLQIYDLWRKFLAVSAKMDTMRKLDMNADLVNM